MCGTRGRATDLVHQALERLGVLNVTQIVQDLQRALAFIHFGERSTWTIACSKGSNAAGGLRLNSQQIEKDYRQPRQLEQSTTSTA